MSSPNPNPNPSQNTFWPTSAVQWVSLISFVLTIAGVGYGLFHKQAATEQRVQVVEQRLTEMASQQQVQGLDQRLTKLEGFVASVDNKLNEAVSILQYLRGKQDSGR
jgi:hypothetical protein